MKTQFNVGAVQPPDIQNDVGASLQVIEKYMAQADAEGVDVLCFPECFLQGYTLDTAETKQRGISFDSTEFKFILEQLETYNAGIILGVIEKDDSHFYNTAAVIKQGKLVGLYRKVNLFEQNFTPGTEHRVFTLDGLTFGINICYDARFAEGALEMASKGAEIIFYPLSNRWPVQKAKKYRYRHIPNLVDRAIESGCWVVSSDVAHQDSETVAYGCGAIVSPEGDVVTRVPELEVGMTNFSTAFAEVPQAGEKQ